jgi:hypothetical protein
MADTIPPPDRRPKPAAPGDGIQPIVIRKLDRLETTNFSSPNN